jgi:hypothetical protein
LSNDRIGKFYHVRLRDRQNRSGNAQISDDLQVFFGLWHPTIVCRDGEKH